MPDATATAAAQTKSNTDTAAFNQTLNMVNSYGPDGSVTYSADPNAPGGYAQTTSLSPSQQAIYNGSTAAQAGAVGIANDQLGRVSSSLGQNLTPGHLQTGVDPVTMGNQSVQNAVNASYDQAKSRLDPEWAIADNQTRTQLANQGLSQNSDAYKNAEAQFGRNKNDAYSTAYNSAVGQGQAEQAQLFGQGVQAGQFGNTAQQQDFQQQAYQQQLPINELSALLGLGQVQSPSGINYTPTGAASTDVIGANSLQSSASAKQAELSQQAMGSLTGGLFSLGSAALGNPAGLSKVLSDRRLKTDIRRVGSTDGGLPVYVYRYKGDTRFQMGVMAQDVQEVNPEAVGPVLGGFLGVDYAMVA